MKFLINAINICYSATSTLCTLIVVLQSLLFLLDQISIARENIVNFTKLGLQLKLNQP